ncbi:hypothetical protein [Desulfoscipio geothermicus]|uniref:Uncharacterized protein n=1 Tax=Desulfoscipio geothermicus DSM 3669 TaxID=1121426 RepID=A0A1I6DXW2_9FIRM|nr:hypothetical protein [Desulfoscipio geothermicus]SFR10256.1 hypothetical protein SAMN05660706_12072 [Desulfoscipio geothermicus DSM 3669]
MQVEILTRNVDKKTAILTALAGEPELQATGEKITIPGLILQATENYLLFNISSTKLVERILPMLFTLKPTGQFYEPVTDVKIIATARCYTPVKILPHLHEINHLDLEKEELLGTRLAEWRSRDVAVTARAELAVQGGVLVARIKFDTHFRDSQYNCQACIEQISLRHLLAPLCPEFTAPAPGPRIGSPSIRAQQKITEQKWVEFINRRPGTVIYSQEKDAYVITLHGGGRISCKQMTEGQDILCELEFASPSKVSSGIFYDLRQTLGIEALDILHRAEDMVLSPDQLMRDLAFSKQKAFHLFALDAGDFTATYDIKSLQLTLSTKINLDDNFTLEALQKSYRHILEFMDKVMDVAEQNYCPD